MANEKHPETKVSQHAPGNAVRSNDGEEIGERRARGSRVSPEVTAPRRVMIVMSPKAGTGLGREELPQLIDRLQRADIQASATDQISQLREFSRRAQQQPTGSDLVVAAGGDGTLSLVAENVFPRMPLVPMPFGTENLLARQFGYISDAEQVFHTICQGQSYWLDAGRANGKLFLVMASCGFDAEVVRALHLTRKGHISRLSYAKPIIRALRRYRFPAIHVMTDPGGPANDSDSADPSSDECRWAMAFNLPKYGGDLSIEPDAVGNDGHLDLILFKRGSLWSGLRYVFGIKTGIHRRFSDVIQLGGKSILMTSEQRVPYQLDGDYMGHLPLAIETLPERIHLRLPVSP